MSKIDIGFDLNSSGSPIAVFHQGSCIHCNPFFNEFFKVIPETFEDFTAIFTVQGQLALKGMKNSFSTGKLDENRKTLLFSNKEKSWQLLNVRMTSVLHDHRVLEIFIMEDICDISEILSLSWSLLRNASALHSIPLMIVSGHDVIWSNLDLLHERGIISNDLMELLGEIALGIHTSSNEPKLDVPSWCINPHRQELKFSGFNIELLAFRDLARQDMDIDETSQSSIELLELLSKNSDLIIWEWDIPSGIVRVPERWAQNLGYEKGRIESTSNGWMNLCHEEDFPEVRKLWIRHFRGEIPWVEKTYRMRSAEGTMHAVLTRGKVIKWGENHRAIRAVGIHQNITREKELEIALNVKNSEVLFQSSILEQITENVLVLDINMQILYMNCSARNIIENNTTKTRTVLGRNLLKSIQNKEILKRTIETGKWETTFMLENDVQQSLWYSVRTWIIEDGRNPETVLVCVIFTEVTSKITGEREKNELEKKLIQSQKISSIGMLVGEIAHDFKNILTSITGNTDMALLETNPEKIRPFLKDIQTANYTASSLISRLLSFSRRHENIIEILDLNSLINDLSEIFKRIVGEKILFTAELPSIPVNVRGDKNRIEQVLLNLVVNAKDAIEGNGEITIRTSRVYIEKSNPMLPENMKNGKFALIKIRDTGKGIPDHQMNLIFEPFFTTKAVSEGTGIGLSTVKGIITGHGGFINLISEVGVGTEFQIFLPATSSPSSGSSTKKHEDKPLTGGTEKILLVEDDKLVRNITMKILKRLGYELYVKESAEQAISFLQNGVQIDVIITDIIMPGINGVEMAEKILKFLPNVYILFISGYADNGQVHEKLKLPGFHFLPKPYTPSELSSKIRFILNSAPSE
ncbi:MAG: response regulator [Deltaproteobacteria bacterium]|nr:response regulator [Deltaproteobacteria bacterium]